MAMDLNQWQSTAVGELLALRNADGGWPFHAGAASATEPTAMAALALVDTGTSPDILSVAADWLLAQQRAGGLLAASPSHEEGSWVTSPAAITLARLGRPEAASTAAQALLAEGTYAFAQVAPDIYGYDITLRGWPWSPGAFTFIEPTAWAVLFLKQAGYTDHDRVRTGVHVIHDRALAAGGWNYGEPVVLGDTLFPTAAPTALALLALADEPDDRTAAGLTWLQTQRGQITSLYSLGWTAIALNLLGALTADGQDEVIASWTAQTAERRDAVGTALCLLGLRATAGHPLALSL
jgi:hypothetical protein